MEIRIEFKPQDLWIGVYWDTEWSSDRTAYHKDVWVCLLPMLPIHLSWSGRRNRG